MAQHVVGVSDGYHSIAFANGLEPATHRPFSITAPVSLPELPASQLAQTAATAEIQTGTLANRTV